MQRDRRVSREDQERKSVELNLGDLTNLKKVQDDAQVADAKPDS